MHSDENQVIADIISRLIGGDMGSGESWRPAATLDFLSQGLATMAEGDDPIRAEVAKDILGDILLSMTYLELAESDEEQEAFDRQWEKIIENVMRPQIEEEVDDEDE